MIAEKISKWLAECRWYTTDILCLREEFKVKTNIKRVCLVTILVVAEGQVLKSSVVGLGTTFFVVWKAFQVATIELRRKLLATYVELNYSPTNVKSFLDLVKAIHSLYFLDIRFSNLGLYNAFNGRQIKYLINVDEINRAGSGVTV
ncbi:MAG: hypothetical protein EXX96DRAFT_538334 [Benjaminiella poitrasii]|nr:MAG: hypothetical protein EXX96DRAFT_538334 [Benjaminiella poitrasii]